MITIYILIVLVNLFALRLHFNSRWIDLLNILFVIVFVGGNSNNPDYEGYMIRFDGDIEGSFEYGYLLLVSVCRELGLQYQYFVTVVCMFSVFFVYQTARHINSNLSCYFILYLSTLCFIDAVQIRQMLCYSIFSLVIYFIAKEQRLLSTILLIIGSLFQSTALFFIPFVLFYKFFAKDDNIKKVWRWGLFICILTFLNGNSIPYLITIVENNLDESKVGYFQSQGRFGFIMYYLYLIICGYCAYVLSRALENNKNIIGRYSKIVYSAYAYAGLSMPLVMQNNTFFRFLNFPLLGLFLTFSGYILISLSKKDFFVVGYYKKKILIGICLTVLSYNVFLQIGNVVSDVFKYNAYYIKYIE